jgi:hypothetical protein
MKSLIYLLALSIALSSCASHKKIAEANTAATAAIAYGSSFEKAICNYSAAKLAIKERA